MGALLDAKQRPARKFLTGFGSSELGRHKAKMTKEAEFTSCK